MAQSARSGPVRAVTIAKHAAVPAVCDAVELILRTTTTPAGTGTCFYSRPIRFDVWTVKHAAEPAVCDAVELILRTTTTPAGAGTCFDSRPIRLDVWTVAEWRHEQHVARHGKQWRRSPSRPRERGLQETGRQSLRRERQEQADLQLLPPARSIQASCRAPDGRECNLTSNL